jgi:hypothetical protein
MIHHILIEVKKLASYDEEDGLDITRNRRKSKLSRFDNKATIPIFSVGMRFGGRK